MERNKDLPTPKNMTCSQVHIDKQAQTLIQNNKKPSRPGRIWRVQKQSDIKKTCAKNCCHASHGKSAAHECCSRSSSKTHARLLDCGGSPKDFHWQAVQVFERIGPWCLRTWTYFAGSCAKNVSLCMNIYIYICMNISIRCMHILHIWPVYIHCCVHKRMGKKCHSENKAGNKIGKGASCACSPRSCRNRTRKTESWPGRRLERSPVEVWRIQVPPQKNQKKERSFFV